MDSATYERMRPVFVDETAHCLEMMDEALLALTNDAADLEARRLLARSAHTIAGNAAAMGYTAMLPETQCIELIATPGSVPEIPPHRLRTLLNARTALRRMLAEIPA